MREIHDHFFRQAKRDGYRSRAAYKLIEIDDRRGVFNKGDFVLDCGAAPGSWLQVAARRVARQGIVVGIDLKPIDPSFAQHENIVVMQGDMRELSSTEILEHVHRYPQNTTADRVAFDVVLSDMAPGTTGDPTRDHFRSAQLCEALLGRLPELLRPGGNFVCKVFEGEMYPELLSRCRHAFDRVKGFRPKASRRESVEMYIVAHDYRSRPPSSPQKRGRDEAGHPPVRSKPTPKPGW